MLTYGVEIEFILRGADQNLVASTVTAAGVPCTAAGYTHAVRNHWKVVRDGSVNGGIAGLELVSPVLREDQFDQIEKVCAALAQLRAEIDRSCGLHVHIGTRNLSLDTHKRLAEFYGSVEPLIDNLMPPSRRANHNQYCRTVRVFHTSADRVKQAATVQQIAQAQPNGRYAKVNFFAYDKYGTVEFRQHSGTVDPAKIIHWARFCGKLVEVAQREETLAAAVPIVPTPAPPTNPGDSTYTNRGNVNYWTTTSQLRVIYDMLSREQGVTREELRQMLELRTRPSIRVYIATAGAEVESLPRRNGYVVWRFTRRPAQAAPQPQPTVRLVPAGSYWNTTATTRAMYYGLQRPEGITAEEVRLQVNEQAGFTHRSSRPNIQWHARRAGAQVELTGQRRGGRQVWRFANQNLVAVAEAAITAAPAVGRSAEVPVPTTLAELMERLQLSEGDRMFWRERQILLGTG